MPTPQEKRSESPSLLLMISDATELDASARSSYREVRRWVPGNPARPSEFTGDPTSPETYAWITGARSVTAVVDLKNDEKSEGVVRALRATRADSALLVLSEAIDHAAGDGTLTRSGTLRDVLRLDLEDELVRLEAERRTYCLQQFVEGHDVVPILIHPDPDPDALSSAYAVRSLLGRSDAAAPIVSTGAISRPENRRMAKLLGLEILAWTDAELKQCERIIAVDMQPSGLGPGGPRLAVIDHHPAETEYHADFLDVRPEYGAVATMMSEYLRACDADRIDAPLATALVYGIRTDTDSLTRGVTPADVNEYAFLQTKSDPALLRRIEKAAMPMQSVEAFGRALSSLRVDKQTAFAYAGVLEETYRHVLADIADFMMEIEGVTRAVAVAVTGDRATITLRDVGRGDGVTELARALGELGGSGGGHATMARAVIPVASIPGFAEGCEMDSIVAVVRSAEQGG